MLRFVGTVVGVVCGPTGIVVQHLRWDCFGWSVLPEKFLASFSERRSRHRLRPPLLLRPRSLLGVLRLLLLRFLLEAPEESFLLRVHQADCVHRQPRERVCASNRATERARVARIHVTVLHELPPPATVLRLAEVEAFWGESSSSRAYHPTDTHARSTHDSRGRGTRHNRMLHDDAARSLHDAGSRRTRFEDGPGHRRRSWPDTRDEADRPLRQPAEKTSDTRIS